MDAQKCALHFFAIFACFFEVYFAKVVDIISIYVKGNSKILKRGSAKVRIWGLGVIKTMQSTQQDSGMSNLRVFGIRGVLEPNAKSFDYFRQNIPIIHL